MQVKDIMSADIEVVERNADLRSEPCTYSSRQVDR
jgi:hypothetical protein